MAAPGARPEEGDEAAEEEETGEVPPAVLAAVVDDVELLGAGARVGAGVRVALLLR